MQLSRVLPQEQYSFLYEALLEGLLCGSTGVPVESIASHVHSLRDHGTSGCNSALEKEFKVPPGDGALVLSGLICDASPLLLPSPAVAWRGGIISLQWPKKGSC